MRRTPLYSTGLLLAGAILVAACSSSTSGNDATAPGQASAGSAVTTADGDLVIPNQGGNLEGHTPRGFAGTGTGLLLGDNLNPGFPDGDGVQAFITFPLDELGSLDLTDQSVIEARLTSIEPTISGNPFADLGDLTVHEVVYDEFGPELFDIEPVTLLPLCTVTEASPLDCNVTEPVAAAVEAGADRVQFRLAFEQAGDGDGQADLASFFVTDSNTNESGLFSLVITPA